MKNAHGSQVNISLRRHRELRGWSLKRVAELLREMDPSLGVNEYMVGTWERGVKVPSPCYREKLCRLYEASVEELGFFHREKNFTGLYFCPKVVRALADAITDCLFVKLVFRDPTSQGGVITRLIYPCRFFSLGSEWYLIGVDHSLKDGKFCHLALSYVLHCEILTQEAGSGWSSVFGSRFTCGYVPRMSAKVV